MEKLVKRIEDGSIAFGACFLSANAATAQAAVDATSVPATNPVLTQVVIPIITGVLLPFLKELIQDGYKRRKERRIKRKATKETELDY